MTPFAVVNGILIAGFAGLFVWVEWHRRKDQALLMGTFEKIHRDLKLLSQSLALIGRKLIDIESRLSELTWMQSEKNINEGNNNAYPQANKMIEMGASIEDVVAASGLSRAEVELLMHIFQQKKIFHNGICEEVICLCDSSHARTIKYPRASFLISSKRLEGYPSGSAL